MAIVFINETHGDQASSPYTINVTINAGDTVLVGIGNGSGIQVSTVTGGGGESYTRLAHQVNVVTSEVWGIISAAATTSIIITLASAGNINASVARFSGVSSFGNIDQSRAALSTSELARLTLQATGNYMYAQFTASGSMATISAEVGTSMERNYSAASGGQFCSSYYNTGSAGSLDCSFTAANAFWTSAAVELEAAAAAGGDPNLVGEGGMGGMCLAGVGGLA